jgi:hypothetical protein
MSHQSMPLPERGQRGVSSLEGKRASRHEARQHIGQAGAVGTARAAKFGKGQRGQGALHSILLLQPQTFSRSFHPAHASYSLP